MAKATLPTNYKDDIMASAMGGKRRYRMINNSDGTISLEDVTNYTQVGSNFGAAQMNQTNTAVNNSADKSKIIDDLDDIAANTQAGMMAGALAVRELNGKINYTIAEKQIGTWSDGKPFYRKVIWFENPGTNHRVAHGINGMKRCVHLYGTAIDKTNNYQIPLPFVSSSSASNNINIGITDTEVRVSSGIDISKYGMYIVIEYTKS